MEQGEGASAVPAMPSADLLVLQAQWLAPARSRLLRRAAIAGRRCVLDLGAGTGAVTGELVRRSSGRVVALDSCHDALRQIPPVGSLPVCGDASALPFRDETFDLVFAQCALMWMDAAAALGEALRVLQRGGVLVALEPDYGGLLEYPEDAATREIWTAALTRAGADPFVGRKLPEHLTACGFDARIELLQEPGAPSPQRLDFLATFALTDAERGALDRAREADARARAAGSCVAHLPFFLVVALKA